MSTRFLAQIAAAGPSTINDTIVGVQAGPTDVQFTLNKLLPIPLQGNLTLYVSPTGSDSNSGTTVGSPFLTLQHAFNFAAQFDFAGNSLQINLAAGTHTTASAISIPAFININNAVVAGAGASTTTFHNTASGKFIVASNSGCQFQDITFDGTGAIFNSFVFGNITLSSTVNVTDSSAGGQSVVFTIGSGGSIDANFINMTVGAPFLYFMQGGGQDSVVNINGTNLTLPASTFGSANNNFWINNQGAGTGIFEMFGTTITNFASFQGSRAIIVASGGFGVFTQNGLVTDIPGVALDSFYDQSCFFGNAIGGFLTGAGSENNTGPWPIADLTEQFWLVTKDTTNGPRSINFTDNGVIYTRQIGNNINTQTGTSYTLALSDQEGIVEMNNAGANTLTVPANATVAFPIGTKISVTQIGAGATTTAAAAGVTLHNAGALTGQFAGARLYKRGTNEWSQFNGAF